jgi:hypothetical protein
MPVLKPPICAVDDDTIWVWPTKGAFVAEGHDEVLVQNLQFGSNAQQQNQLKRKIISFSSKGFTQRKHGIINHIEKKLEWENIGGKTYMIAYEVVEDKGKDLKRDKQFRSERWSSNTPIKSPALIM